MELRGKTVLLTRTANQSEELRDGLTRLGALVVECPSIEIVPVEDWTLVDRAIVNLNTYHWVLFTSANAVEHFMTRWKQVSGTTWNTPVAAIGKATAGKLSDWNISPALIPEDSRAEGLLRAFPEDLTGSRILFPRAAIARELLPEELRRRGAVVEILTVYRTTRGSSTTELRSIFEAQHVDCVVFTSPSTVRFVVEALEGEFAAVLQRTAVAVIGPVTAQAAESFGLQATIRSTAATMPDLIEAIRRYYALKTEV